jgi:hypothetical protein
VNVLDTLRAERPDVAPLDPAMRAALRERVVGTAAWVRVDIPEDGEHEVAPVAPTAPAARGSWLTVAAILIVGLGLAAVIVTAGRPWSMPPAAPPSTTADRGPLYPSATVPVVESMPDPLVIGAIDPLDVVESVATTAVPEPPFTPLALAEPPAGYELESATYVPGNGHWGMATYVTDSSTTQIWLLVTSSRTWFDQLPGLGRTTWQVGDVTVYDDGEGGGGCLVDVCSVGWAWDDETYVSLKWVEPNAGTLAAGATHATLLELVPTVVERADIWELDDPPPTTAPFDDSATLPTPTAFGDTEELVLIAAPDQDVVESYAAMSTAWAQQVAAVVDPDGNLLTVELSGTSGSPEDGEGEWRRVGDLDVRAIAGPSGTVDNYAVFRPCWYLRINDPTDADTRGIWRSAVVELLAAAQPGDAHLAMALPAAWTSLGVGAPSPLFELLLSVPTEDGATTVTVSQGPGSNVAFTNGPARSGFARVPFLGGSGWVSESGLHASTVVMWERDGTSFRAEAEGLTAHEIELAVDEMRTSTVDDWVRRYGEPRLATEDIVAAVGCPTPTLSISGG